MKTTQWKSITVSLVCVIILILSGCKVTESTYRKVATDTRVTSEKKAIIAPWVSVYFPVTPSFIKGDDIITVDTVWTAYSYTDSFNTRDTVYATIKKVIHRTDTLKTEDYSKLLISRREITQLQAEVIIEQSLRRQAEIEKAKVKERQRNLWFVIIALSLSLLGAIYFHLRKLF